MTPEEVGARLVALLAPVAATPSVSGGQRYARATVDVPPASWPDAVRAARDDTELACDFFDWLSAVDELAEGFDVVAHLWSTRLRHGVLLRTRVPRGTPRWPRWSTSIRAPPGTSGRRTRCSASASPATVSCARCCCRRSSRAIRCARSSCSPRGWPSPGRARRSRANPRPAVAAARSARRACPHPGSGEPRPPRPARAASARVRVAAPRPDRPVSGPRGQLRGPSGAYPRPAGTADGPAAPDQPTPGAGPVAGPPARDDRTDDGGTA
ncbi:hypothetical protein GCM10027614_56920 [Micromonospora vulcania]